MHNFDRLKCFILLFLFVILFYLFIIIIIFFFDTAVEMLLS